MTQIILTYILNYGYDNILEAIARDCLSVKRGGGGTRRKEITPGWMDFLKPYQTESLYWHGHWGAVNKPTAGPLFEAMQCCKKTEECRR